MQGKSHVPQNLQHYMTAVNLNKASISDLNRDLMVHFAEPVRADIKENACQGGSQGMHISKHGSGTSDDGFNGGQGRQSPKR